MSRRFAIVTLAVVGAALGAWGQQPLEAVSRYVATVEAESQRLLLRWSPCADSAVGGYCVSTDSTDQLGTLRWIAIDTLHSRLDTVCQPPAWAAHHLFRIHAFDTSLSRQSAMTEPFGGLELEVDMRPCARQATVGWTLYEGMPGGVASYLLQQRDSPSGSWREVAVRSSAVAHSVEVELDDTVSRPSFRVVARSVAFYGLEALSSCYDFVRPVADTARYLVADTAWFDPQQLAAVVRFRVDPTFATTYTLYRSSARWPLARIATLDHNDEGWVEYVDSHVSRSDSLYHYLISTYDRCGLNLKWSDTLTLIMPGEADVGIYFPNVIVPSADGPNARFCPQFVGLLNEGYSLVVYDRMGRLLFTTTDPATCWDGTDLAGHRLPQGAYPYVAHGRFADRSKRTVAGTVTIIR